MSIPGSKSLSYFWFLLVLVLFFHVPCSLTLAQDSNKTRLQDNWEFVRSDLGGVWEAIRMEKSAVFPVWEKVSLPHCYNAWDAVDPDVKYYEGPAWYRTRVNVKNPFSSGRTLLHFEGAGQKTKVWIYDSFVGEHVGGYDEFTFDITDAVNRFLKNDSLVKVFNGQVPVVVRSDNSRDLEMIPSDLSDFNLYGGLYRNVNLVYKPSLSVNNLWITPKVDTVSNTADITIDADLFNPLKLSGEIEADFTITDPSGKKVYTGTSSFKAFSGRKEIVRVTLSNPYLWSTDSPDLYRLQLEISSSRGKENISQGFGIRYFRFIEHGPFYLNGSKLPIRGTHRHEDHAGVGAAMTDEMIRTEMKMIKEMGANFIRLGHYQQSRLVLELCDELGLMVWEEIPWCRGGLGNDIYKDQARRMLTNMITQHYNHPSVIIWGLGNENDWPGDFEEFDKSAIAAFMSELNNLSHKLDPGRMTAIRRCEFCKDIVDIYAPSIWAGWYSGKYTDYRSVAEKWNKNVNHFLHIEWGADCMAGRHSENTEMGLQKLKSDAEAAEKEGDFLPTGGTFRASKDGDWSESYACNLIDWHLKEQEQMPWLSGSAYWPFKDFSTPLRPENPVPYVNQKGVVTRDLAPKESYYIFQSYWTENPMIHIYGHSFTTRWGKQNELKEVKIYSNCTEAELILNGNSLGKKIREKTDFPASGLRWDVKFREGENHLEARGTKEGVTVVDKISVNYQVEDWGAPAILKIDQVRSENDTSLIRVIALDSKGVPCLDTRVRVRFNISGDGVLLDNLGTPDGSRLVELSNGKAWIKVKLNQGTSVVSVSSEGIKTSFIETVGNYPGKEIGESFVPIAQAFPGVKEVKSKMVKVCDWQLANMPEQSGRHYLHNDWTNASFFTGCLSAYYATGKKAYIKALTGFAEEVKWRPGLRFRHADDLCIGQTFLELYFLDKQDYMITPIKSRIDSLIADPRPGREDWWWCDALFMEPPVLARLYKATGDITYLDYMNSMWWVAFDFLYDREERLYYRDDKFRIKEDGSGRRESNGEKVFWSRGNGWVLAGLARILNYIPDDYPDKVKYIELFREMSERIVELQNPDGLWRPSLLYPEPFKHGETSGSGFYCFALAWGINNGILEKDMYLPYVQKTWKAMNQCVSPEGKLGWVQQIGYAPDKINADMTEIYGPGAYLLAGAEIIKLLENDSK